MTPEEAHAVAESRFTLLYEGELLPVTKMYDFIGAATDNPMSAFACVAYNGDKDNWLAVQVHPGEIVAKRDLRHAAISSLGRV